MLASLSLRLIRDSANGEMWAVNDRVFQESGDRIGRFPRVASAKRVRRGGVCLHLITSAARDALRWQPAVKFEVVGLFDELAAVHPEGEVMK